MSCASDERHVIPADCLAYAHLAFYFLLISKKTPAAERSGPRAYDCCLDGIRNTASCGYLAMSAPFSGGIMRPTRVCSAFLFHQSPYLPSIAAATPLIFLLNRVKHALPHHLDPRCLRCIVAAPLASFTVHVKPWPLDGESLPAHRDGLTLCISTGSSDLDHQPGPDRSHTFLTSSRSQWRPV